MSAAGAAPALSTGSDNGPCVRCGRSDYAGLGGGYWFADNDLWNEVFPDRTGLCCPACFTAICREKGIEIGWRAGRVGEIEDLAAPVSVGDEPMDRCDCNIPYLEGAGQHSPGCSVFKTEPRP